MLPINYIICSNQMNSGVNGKVFKIIEINRPNKIFIIKIFEEMKNKEYEDEKSILSLLKDNTNNLQNDYLIKLRDIDIRLEYSENYRMDSKLLVFDYLHHGTMCDYLNMMPNINNIKEIYVKLFGYKLLKGLKKCHENNICHNKIAIKNIMFDNDFNPIIIHFSEASLINNKNFNKDFIGLGIVLAKLITSGQFMSFKYDKNKKRYVFIHKKGGPNKKGFLEESHFWKIIESNNNIKISKEFKQLFDILVKSKSALNIDDLLNNEFFKDIINNQNNLNEIEKQLKEEFEANYNEILKSKEQDTQDLDIYSILNLENTEDNSLFNPRKRGTQSSFDRNRSLVEEEENLYENKNLKLIKYEPKGIQFNYIEINIKDNEIFYLDALGKFMIDLENNIKVFKYGIDLDINIEHDPKNWAFSVSFEEKEIDEGDNIEDNIDNIEEETDAISEDLNDSSLIPLIINIELYEFEKKEKITHSLNSMDKKYYLMFNYIQGDTSDFYEYLKIIKNITIKLLKHEIEKI